LNSNHDQTFLHSLFGFENNLLRFVGDSYNKGILALLGINVVTSTAAETSSVIIAAHKPTLTLYDFQKLCSILCAYRFFEVISLRAQCISRIPASSPTPCMFLPGPASAKKELHVSAQNILLLIFNDPLGLFSFAKLAEASNYIPEISERID
jgi:hypothetical protein